MPKIPTIEFDATDDFECDFAIGMVFEKITEKRGETSARKLFAPYGKKLTKRDLAHRENVRLAVEFFRIPEGRRSISKLAKRLAAENETLRPEKRWGPNGSTDPFTMKKQLERVLKDRRVLADEDVINFDLFSSL